MRFIAKNFDRILAIVGALGALALVVWFSITTEGYLFPAVGGLSFIACLGYLVLKSRVNPSYLALEYPGKVRLRLLLSIAFFAIITGSLLVMILRADLYSRPLAFFICMTVAAVILVFESIIISPNSRYIVFILSKIIFFTLILVLTPQLLFPNVLGIDTFFHSEFTQDIITSGHIASTGPFESYSAFPAMHLNTAAPMLTTSLDYRMVNLLFTSPVYVIAALAFVYLIGAFTFSSKVGLLAALLLGSATIFIRLGWWMVPNGYATMFILAILFVLFRTREKRAKTEYIIVALLMAALIITHTIAALSLLIILLAIWFGINIYNLLLHPYIKRTILASFRLSESDGFKTIFTLRESAWRQVESPLINLRLIVVFGIAMVLWWITNSPTTVTTLNDLMRYGLTVDIFASPAPESVAYGLTVPIWENVLRISSYAILWAVAFIGCLAAFSVESTNRHFFALAASGTIILAIGFFSIPLGLSTLPDRWQFLSIFILVIPASVGLLNIASTIKGNYISTSVISIIIAILVFLSITGPLSIVDSPIWAHNTTVRYAIKDSEARAVNTITNSSNKDIGTDYYLASYFRSPNLYYSKEMVYEEDFSAWDGIVLLRTEVLNNPISAPGIIRLNYDPMEVLENQGFSKIYSSDTVYGYLAPQQ